MTGRGELRFDGRVALVTGGGRGIGRAHALLLAARGAMLLVNNRSIDAAEAVADEICRAGGRAIADSTDISREGAPETLVSRAVATFGSIDIVVHNAGNSIHRNLQDLELSQFDLMMRTHIAPCAFLAKAAWPHMLKQQRGRFMLTSSGSGFWGQTDNHDYSAAKSGVHGIMRSLSIAGRDKNIYVNCIAPRAGTDLAARTVKDPITRDILMNAMPPALVAPLVAWLVHDSCTINGGAFDVGGGLVRRIFVGVTRGYGSDGLTAEQLRDNFDDVLDTRNYIIPTHAMDLALDTWRPRPKGRTEA